MIYINSNKPIVSVIIPFYNAEKTIDRAISSIALQSFKNFECILVNNNSNDSSAEIVEKWIKKDKRFKLITEKKQGVVFASNTGTGFSQAPFIARMDADDWSFPNRIEVQINYLKNNPEIDVVAGRAKYISHNSNTKGFLRFVNWNNSIMDTKEIFNKRFMEMPVINPTLMWRKEIGQQYGLYNHGSFPEDYEMCLRWLQNKVSIIKLSNFVIKWYDSDNRLSRTHDNYSKNSFYKIKTSFLVKWLKENNTFYPNVSIWGASRLSRQRANILKDYGIDIKFYIDIKKTRQINDQIVYYKDIPGPDQCFILVYISYDKARKEIQNFLHQKGFIEGENYFLVS